MREEEQGNKEAERERGSEEGMNKPGAGRGRGRQRGAAEATRNQRTAAQPFRDLLSREDTEGWLALLIPQCLVYKWVLSANLR
jgi:hypothetical protein